MTRIKEAQQTLEQLCLSDRLVIERWLRDLNEERVRESAVAEARLAHAPEDPPFMTLEEYFEFEQRSEIRHEYVGGAVFAISGPSVTHERIRNRLVRAFDNYLKSRRCEVFSSGMQLLIRREASDICYYPDLMVDCRRDWDKHFVRSPTLVLEILSPSTQLTDRREKLQNYRLIDSVEEYVLASQDEHKLTIYRRADGWQPQVCAGAAATAEFRSIGLTLSLSEIYENILIS